MVNQRRPAESLHPKKGRASALSNSAKKQVRTAGLIFQRSLAAGLAIHELRFEQDLSKFYTQPNAVVVFESVRAVVDLSFLEQERPSFDLVFWSVILACVYAVSRRSWSFIVGLSLAVPALGTDIALYFYRGEKLLFASCLLDLVFLVFVTGVIMGYVVRQERN